MSDIVFQEERSGVVLIERESGRREWYWAREIPDAEAADLNSAGFPDPASMGGVISQGGVASVREVQPDRPTRGPANDKPDCCSGFVTQEGRDIHQAIEHEPRRTYPPCGQPVAAGGPCLRDAAHYGVCSAAPDSAQQEPR